MNGNERTLGEAEASTRIKRARRGAPRRRTVIEYVSGVDRPFLITVILLLCIGVVTVFSASYPFARANYNNSYLFAVNQTIWAVVGLAVMWAVAKFIPYNFIRIFSKPILIFGIVLLVIVALAGSGAKGAVRWIEIGPITFQPSEIMKFALVLFFADYADKYADKIAAKDNFTGIIKPIAIGGLLAILALGTFFVIDNIVLALIVAVIFFAAAVVMVYPANLPQNVPGLFYGVLPYIAVLGTVVFLLYLQPHISGIMIMTAITLAMMFIGGIKMGYVAFGGITGAIAGVVLMFSKSHSSDRLKVWFNPFDYLLDGGWQPAQSLYAIGSGGFWGVGFGNSRQKHLYLPEPQNDYIFSIFCEEMGFLGAFIVICIFAFFIYRGILIGLRAPDKFSSMLVLGIIMHVAIQVILNIAVVTNTIPSTGISLPFFSYGGTSLLILLAEMGVVLSVSRYSAVERTA